MGWKLVNLSGWGEVERWVYALGRLGWNNIHMAVLKSCTHAYAITLRSPEILGVLNQNCCQFPFAYQI